MQQSSALYLHAAITTGTIYITNRLMNKYRWHKVGKCLIIRVFAMRIAIRNAKVRYVKMLEKCKTRGCVAITPIYNLWKSEISSGCSYFPVRCDQISIFELWNIVLFATSTVHMNSNAPIWYAQLSKYRKGPKMSLHSLLLHAKTNGKYTTCDQISAQTPYRMRKCEAVITRSGG